MAEVETVHLHIDVMDLAGKTTATNNIILKFGGKWEVRRNSLNRGNPIYDLADQLRVAGSYDAEVLGWLYTVALRADIHGFKRPEMSSIQDSTIYLRSYAYHTVKGNHKIIQVLEDIFPQHPDFDVSVVLIADIQSRLERLRKRQLECPWEVAQDDLMVMRDQERFTAMEACLVDVA